MFRVTNRKTKVVDHLRQFGPTTGSQLQEFFFADCTKQNRTQHLKNLEKLDLISKISIRTLLKKRLKTDETPLLPDVLEENGISEKSKLPDTFNFIDTNRNEWVYFLNRKLSYLMYDYTEKNSLKFVAHQIIVNDIFNIYKTLVEPESILSDSQILGINGHNRKLLGPIPDLIINQNGVRIAIEVELSLKVSSRYKKKAERYRYSDFDHIIYYCASDGVAFNLSQHFSDSKKIHFSLLVNKKNLFKFGEESISPRQLMEKLGVIDESKI